MSTSESKEQNEEESSASSATTTTSSSIAGTKHDVSKVPHVSDSDRLPPCLDPTFEATILNALQRHVKFNPATASGSSGGGGGGEGSATAVAATSTTEGSRKRPRKDRKVCFDWEKGKCQYGDKCRYAHSKETGHQKTMEEARVVLRAMSQVRMEKLNGSTSSATTTSTSSSNIDSTGAGKYSNTDVGSAHNNDSVRGGEALDNMMMTPLHSSSSSATSLDATTVQASSSSSSSPAVHFTPFTAIQRYFTPLFAPDGGGFEARGEDQYVYVQSNRVCVVGAAPSHPVVRSHIPVVSVTYPPQLASIAVVGKKKRGSVFVDSAAILCTVKLANGKKYTFRSCCKGMVMEINDRLVQEPWLLGDPTAAATFGWIALMECKIERVLELQTSLLQEDLYKTLCALRQLPSTAEEATRWVYVVPSSTTVAIAPTEADAITTTTMSISGDHNGMKADVGIPMIG